MTASTMANRAVDRRPFGWSLFLALIPGTIFLLVFFLRASRVVDGVRTFTLFDDALISMSYGRTLATTGDWVWFPDAERVQGFTNPLWSLYMALIHATGMNGNAAVIAISVTGIVIVLLCAIAVGVTLHRSLGPFPHAVSQPSWERGSFRSCFRSRSGASAAWRSDSSRCCLWS